MNKAAVLALLATACTAGTEEHFVLDYETRTLGAGLEHAFMPMRIVCEPHQQFPYACHQRRATVDVVTASGAGEISSRAADGFSVYAREAGTAVIDLQATVDDDEGLLHFTETFEIDVAPIAYSQVGWYTSDSITEPTGAAFRASTVSVWQHHYREPRERLAGALTSTITAAELDGEAAFVVDPRTTSASLAFDDSAARRATEIVTGETLGTATVHTTAGGSFDLDVVDESAIARLELDTEYDVLPAITLRPYDAAGRPIFGCPATGPAIVDTAGAVTVTEIKASAWLRLCEVQLDWTQAPIDTTLVVSWGGRQVQLAIDVP